MRCPRLMFAAPSSGSGKTTITCGILKALQNRGVLVSSFKCGPDYIDPLFHETVLRTPSRSLDTFFTDEETTRYLFARSAKGISVLEGAMGFYDGLGGIDTKASSYDIARVTDTPVVLIVDARGMSRSVLAQIQGFVQYRPDSHIRGVILNQMTQSACDTLRPLVERELGVRVYGCVPRLKDWDLKSRHLGLVLPDEQASLSRQLDTLAELLETSVDLDGLLACAKEAPPLAADCPEKLCALLEGERAAAVRRQAPLIALARDEAFCFVYEDNLRLLRDLGARIVPFSPIRDRELPDGAQGLLLYGGYPELHAAALSQNVTMRRSVREQIENGLPTLAECGGFLYLHRELADGEGKRYAMAGVVEGRAYPTDRLKRFGYVSLEPVRKKGFALPVRGHEFHYFESTACGDAYEARKPVSGRRWRCIWATETSLIGFPHLYYPSAPNLALSFLETCCGYGAAKRRGV